MNAYSLADPVGLRRRLAETHRVWEVRGAAGEAPAWTPLAADDARPFAAHAAPPAFSAKQFFFAERERLFTFTDGKFTASAPTVAPFVLFGVTACDLHAVRYQDRFFAGDPNYEARRRQALLVGLDCNRACAAGFCPAVDAGPQCDSGLADLVLHPRAEGGYWLIAAGARGAEICERLGLPPAPAEWRARRAAAAEAARASFAIAPALAAGIRAINEDAVAARTWEDIALRCLACSGCTMVCPTCSCYATFDARAPQGAIERRRAWDSCLFEGFQKEAGGYNPSARPGQRTRRFWVHKFGDAFKQDCGRYGCVGCGRCDQTCPGAVGVTGVLRRIAAP